MSEEIVCIFNAFSKNAGTRSEPGRFSLEFLPITKVTKQHPVDSKDVAFQIAGKQAFKQGILECDPCLLEPIYDLEIKVPEDHMGDVMGDISGRRGKIQGMDASGQYQIIKAQVPQRELYSYATVLRSITGGRGWHQESFSHYEEMPRDLEQKVISESKAEEA